MSRGDYRMTGAAQRRLPWMQLRSVDLKAVIAAEDSTGKT